MDAEKPHFPHGEQSVNEMFPDMREAARLQNQGGGDRDMEKIGGELHVASGEKEKGESEKEGSSSEKQQMNKTMHDLGP
jgi:hypothetical protein